MYATDKSYLVPLAVSVQSLIETRNTNYTYNIHVISFRDNVPSEDWVRFKAIEDSDMNVRLHLHEIEQEQLRGYMHRVPHISNIGLAILFLPELLPTLNKVLWLDVDTLVKKDISSMYFSSLSESWIAAAKIEGLKFASKLGSLPSYFNSGVVLFDLKKMRQLEVTNKITRFVGENAKDGIVRDQEILNVMFYDNTEKLELKYNNGIAERYLEVMSPRKFNSLYEDTAIFHNIGTAKVWKPAKDILEVWSRKPMPMYYFYSFYLSWWEQYRKCVLFDDTTYRWHQGERSKLLFKSNDLLENRRPFFSIFKKVARKLRSAAAVLIRR